MILVDATPLYNLGQIGELELLGAFGGRLHIPETVAAELTVEPAATNLERFSEDAEVVTERDGTRIADAQALLGVEETTSDVVVVAALLGARDRGDAVTFVSDDTRLRAIADGLGAVVTGSFGVVVRASVADKYFTTTQAKRVLRRMDHHGLQLTGTLRERAIGEVDG